MVQVWDAATGLLLQIFEGYSSWVQFVAFSPDGQKIVSGSDNKMVRVWDAVTGLLLQIFKNYSDWIQSMVFSSDS